MWRALCLLSIGFAALPAGAGDAKRGAESYRACVACHSLEPDVHLTGPSLDGAWGRKAGTAERYIRYSKALKESGIVWDETTLNAWLAGPADLVPGTYMVLRMMPRDEGERGDLIAFLKLATAPGGAKAVRQAGLILDAYIAGQAPEPLNGQPVKAQVTGVRHCEDSYFITTADGVETPYWEMNVRLKIDSRSTGPTPGKPVVADAGMMGDRISVVFASLPELKQFLVEKC